MPATTAVAARPQVDVTGAAFALPDPQQRLAGVWLVQEVAIPRAGPEFKRSADGTGWTVRLDRPLVDRMEYQLELLHPDGRTEVICDPANPLRAPGPFGDKSVVEFPGYEPPAWLDADPANPASPASPASPAGHTEDLTFDCPDLGEPMRIRLWASPGASGEDRLPLLLAHDGIEYAQYSGLPVMLDRLTSDGTLPPMRAALVHPVNRDEHYAASPTYARVLSEQLLPFLHAQAPIAPGRHMRVGLGASLGALAMLHVHRSYPSTFGGMFLQSASLFHHRYDRFAISLEHFTRIRQFLDRVHAERDWHSPIPIRMTCGRVEMNFANNRAASLALRRQGYDLDFRPVPDAHNWIGWRDAWSPGLVRLLQTLWT